MTILNESQRDALSILKKWWKSTEYNIVLTAPAGYGKTYLVDSFLTGIDAVPMLLAPTHEALSQLSSKVSGNYPKMTVHAALGIRPTIKEGSIEFTWSRPNAALDEVNLLVVDEASMLSEALLERILLLGKKVLFVGHDAQLPPVDPNRPILSRAESPVFKLDNVPVVKLNIPMRNSGALQTYLVQLEQFVFDTAPDIKGVFDVSLPKVNDYMMSPLGKDELYSGKATILAWTNIAVTDLNRKVRNILFPGVSEKYVIGDKVILTSPVAIVEVAKYHKVATLVREVRKGDTLHTNTPAEVIQCSVVDWVFEGINIAARKVTLRTMLGDFTVYEVEPDDYEMLAKRLEHRAWAAGNKRDIDKAYMERWDILSCLCRMTHSYASTAHRVQGRTIPTVVVMVADIRKNRNLLEAKKCWYTAASRASLNLMVYKGMLSGRDS